ncbi:MAG: exodeoxyribonuclease III [Clostridiales bacterium]|jgi:exodeoxyribonuclease-3|nr:exodeoxyribonuclease III [Clostridiales bacterium]
MLKLVSWNVNGLRACLGKGGFMDSFRKLDADIFCLQETKMERGQAEIDLTGYREYWNSAAKKGYSGTAVFSRKEPLSVEYGVGIPEHDTEGRVIRLEFDRFILVNVYTPNSQRGLLRLPYRMRWEEDFLAFLKRLESERKKPVVFCGDLNVAHEEIDIKNARSNRHNAGFTDEERAKMTELLGAGFCDTFRHYNPERRDAYTWWSYMAGARDRNIGWRIDYFIVSAGIIGKVAEPSIYSEIYGSDHCPVGILLDENL